MNPNLHYVPPGPEVERFFYSNAFVAGIRGPIGSGKTTACAFRIWRHLMESKPCSDGKRKARWAVTRNTYPELRTTTIATWHQWFPREVGEWRDTGPPTHIIKGDDFELEVLFLALDRPDDIGKLLSLELTGAWMNEAREQPKAVLDGLTGRVGRYPAIREGGDTWSGVIMDTNSPDSDHWWYRLAEEDRPEDFAFFSQPSGRSPKAENIENLPLGYYKRASQGKDRAWVDVFIEAKYGFIRDGKPVYPEFVDSLHVRDVPSLPGLGLWLGLDFGLTPAAVFGQRDTLGRWSWIDELVATDMGAVRFAEELAAKLRRDYQNFEVAGIFGDPAGGIRGQGDERTVFDILKQKRINAKPAPSNDPTLRREAVAVPLTRLIDGVPGLLVHPRCRQLRKGMGGGYAYKRVPVVGQERYQDKPDKNHFSHVCEAGQYLMLGAGEGNALVRTKPTGPVPRQTDESGYSYLDGHAARSGIGPAIRSYADWAPDRNPGRTIEETDYDVFG